MTFTAQQVEDAFKLLIDEDDPETSWDELAYGDGPECITINGEEVPVTHVLQQGGEGEGDSIWFVLKVGEQLFRQDGYYASHYGTDWDGDFYEVEAVEKPVTFYVKK